MKRMLAIGILVTVACSLFFAGTALAASYPEQPIATWASEVLPDGRIHFSLESGQDEGYFIAKSREDSEMEVSLFDNEGEWLTALGPVAASLDEPGEGVYKTASAASSPISAANESETLRTTHRRSIMIVGYLNDQYMWRNKSQCQYDYIYDGTYVVDYWAGYGS